MLKIKKIALTLCAMLTLLALGLCFTACSTPVKYKNQQNTDCVFSVWDGGDVDVEYIIKQGNDALNTINCQETYGTTSFKYSKGNGYFTVILSEENGNIKSVTGTFDKNETEITLYGWKYKK